MRKVNHKSLLQIVTLIVFIFITPFTYAYSSIDEENTVNNIFETHGKSNVVDFILRKRNGKITIQKKKSFLNASGRPDITLVTAKSIIHDLKTLNIDVSSLKPELDIYIEDEVKKRQKKANSRSNSTSESDDHEIPLSKKLRYKIKKTESEYNEAESEYERKQLKYELSRLQREYKQAKYNEKYKSDTYSPNKSQRNKKNYRNSSYCNSKKSQLQKLTGSVKRHQIFFCSDSSYRAENPSSCGKRNYSKQYSLQEYKNEISQLRQYISKNCGS